MANNLIVKILGDDSGLKNTLSGIGPVAKKGLGLAVKATAAVGAGFVYASKKALDFSGELEQNLGGAKAVFGEFADEIEKKAEKAFKNMGLSTADYLATANKMGSLFKGAGFEMEEAMNLTSEAMQRAADVASIMGLDTSAAMESIAGAAKGNFTMMDNLGVAMNDTTLNAYALEIGLGKTTAQMTNQEKIGLAMEMFLDRTAYAAGNYARENETLAGALSTAGAALKNFMSGAGDTAELQDALKNASNVIVKNLKVLAPQLSKGIIEVVKGLAPVVPEIILELLPGILDTVILLFEEAYRLLPEFISKIASAIGDAVPQLKPLTDALAFIGQNLDAVTKALVIGAAAFVTYKIAAIASAAIISLTTTYKLLTGALEVATVAQYKMNAAAMANPYVLAAAAIVGLIAAIASFIPKVESARDRTVAAIDEINKSYEEQIKSIDDTMKSQTEEASKVEFLKERLYDLESQLKNTSLSEAEAKIIQDNFNRSANELNEIIPGIINNLYDETGAIAIQKGKVDSLATSYIQLAQAKAYATALEQKMTATASAMIDAKEVYDTAKAEQNEKYSKDEIGNWKYSYAARTDSDAAVKAAATSYTNLQEKLDGYTKDLNEWQNKITALSSDTSDAIIDDSNKVTDTAVTDVGKRSEAAEEAYEKELRDMKFYREMGVISDAEYYAKLTKYRDTYFEQGSEEWQGYTEEIADYYESVMEEVTESQKKQLDSLKEERDSFAEGLRSHDSVFETTQKVLFDDHGRVAGYVDDIELNNFAEQTKEIKRFGDNLQKLKNKADIPKELFSEIQKMSREEGIKLTDELLSLSDEDFKTWVNSYSEMVQASNDVADELYSDEFADLKAKFDEVWEDVPEDFYTLGINSADEFSQALQEQLIKKISAMRTTVMSGFTGLVDDIQVASEQQGETGGGTTYNVTYDFTNNPATTPREQLDAATDHSTKEQMKGGY